MPITCRTGSVHFPSVTSLVPWPVWPVNGQCPGAQNSKIGGSSSPKIQKWAKDPGLLLKKYYNLRNCIDLKKGQIWALCPLLDVGAAAPHFLNFEPRDIAHWRAKLVIVLLTSAPVLVTNSIRFSSTRILTTTCAVWWTYLPSKCPKQHVRVSGWRRGVNDIFALQKSYAA
jgi:hypothetical protein